MSRSRASDLLYRFAGYAREKAEHEAKMAAREARTAGDGQEARRTNASCP
jgi:hypothetical protein